MVQMTLIQAINDALSIELSRDEHACTRFW